MHSVLFLYPPPYGGVGLYEKKGILPIKEILNISEIPPVQYGGQSIGFTWLPTASKVLCGRTKLAAFVAIVK